MWFGDILFAVARASQFFIKQALSGPVRINTLSFLSKAANHMKAFDRRGLTGQGLVAASKGNSFFLL